MQKEKKIQLINDVRQSWLDIFKEEGYFLLSSSSLIPQNDDSIL